VGTIVLPVMLSLGIANITAGALFLFGISLGGMFNLASWQLYIDVLNIDREQIAFFVVRFAAIMAALVLAFLAIELKKPSNIKYIVAMLVVLAPGFAILSLSTPAGDNVGASTSSLSVLIVGVVGASLVGYAASRHVKGWTHLPGAAMLTPFIPLVLVLACHWD